jgi:hypothetical protein
MYVATNCSLLSSLCEPFLPLLLRNYPNLKGRNSVALERDFRTSDLIPSGQQMEAELLLPKLKMKKFRNK